MSHRPEVHGFRLETMRSLIGSGDRLALEELTRRVEDASEVPGAHAPLVAVLERAIHRGAPFDDLEAERGEHVSAAIFLASHGQEMSEWDSNDWKLTPFDELADDLRPHLDARASELLNLFVAGRPIFGRTIADPMWAYCYLSHAEVAELRAALSAFRETWPDFEGSEEYIGEFLECMVEWLAGIESNGEDLFFFQG